MKLKFIKFANAVRVNNKVSTSAESRTSDIEILGGTVVKIKDKHTGRVICTSLYNTIEFEVLDDAPAETSDSAPAGNKKERKAK